MSGGMERSYHFVALTPVRLEDFKNNSNKNCPTPMQVVKHYSQVDQPSQQNSADISLSLQNPDWQAFNEDGDATFPWLPSHPQAVLQVPDGSEDFQIAHIEEEVVPPPTPSPFLDVIQEQENTVEQPASKSRKRQFQCSCCGKSYRLRTALDKHLKTPCDVRPFKCDICQKAFKRLDHLKAHSRMHTGERPYLCSLCGKTFRQKNHLQRHADRAHVNGEGTEGEDVTQDQNSSDVCGLDELEDDEKRTEDQD